MEKVHLFLIILAVLLFSCLGSTIQESFDIGRDLSNLGGAVGQGIGNLGRGMGDVVGGVGRGVGDVVGGVGQGLGNVVGGVGRGVGDVVGGVGQGLSDVVGGAGYGVDDLMGEEGVGGTIPFRDEYPEYNTIEEEELPRRRRHSDRWILKSQIVPPVCPKCPDIRTCRQTPCPACPPCARCPEPAFTCEKVPNYHSRNDSYLPRPVLNDFSTFGM
jgi:hypothetical protein